MGHCFHEGIPGIRHSITNYPKLSSLGPLPLVISHGSVGQEYRRGLAEQCFCTMGHHTRSFGAIPVGEGGSGGVPTLLPSKVWHPGGGVGRGRGSAAAVRQGAHSGRLDTWSQGQSGGAGSLWSVLSSPPGLSRNNLQL